MSPRTSALAALSVSALALLPATAAADGPAARCPAPYVIFEIPQDGSRPVAAAVDASGNADGFACQLPLQDAAAAHVGAPYNVIDNRVLAP